MTGNKNVSVLHQEEGGIGKSIPPSSWWSTDILSSLPRKALIGFHRYLMKTNENQLLLIKTSENQQIPMNERFAFDDICVFGYFVSAYFCIFVQDSCFYLSVCHNHHIFFLLDPVIHENEGKRNHIMFLIRIHYDDGNTVLFISVAD